MKRLLSLLLALVLLIGMIPVQANAKTLDNGLVYEVYEDHVEITGYTGNATEVVIPTEIEGKPVTEIGNYAFSYCTSLTSIVIPDSVTNIGARAFSDCSSLSSIVIPDSVTYIDAGTFSNCSNLTSIVIPGSVTSIDTGAFYFCTSLTDFVIPDSVTYIGYDAFYHCASLTDIVIPDNVTYIGRDAFRYCESLTEIRVDENNQNYSSDDRGVLFDKEKTVLIQAPGAITDSYVIPEGVTSIRDFAFSYCYSLTDIDLPNTVTSIGDCTFSSCTSLTSIVIPDTVTYIGDHAFASCSSLTEIRVDENNPNYSSDDRGVLFDKGKTVLIQAPEMITDSYVIPDSVTSIGVSAFFDCENLTAIVIPDSISAIGMEAFAYCRNLTGIVIPEGVTSIGDGTFAYCRSLSGIGIPDTVTSIGDSAFSDCSSLTSIVIPDSVTSIGLWAFSNCSSLTEIRVDENNPNYSSDDRGVLFDKGKTVLIQAPAMLTDSYMIPEGVISIRDSAFYYCSEMTGIVIPDSVTSIGFWTFTCCYSLTSIRFVGNAPEFGDGVFFDVTATAYYPVGNPTWTEDVMQDYSGTIVWIPYDPGHIHEYTPIVTAPTCTEQGFTTYTCACGDYYVTDYVDTLDHEYTPVVTNPGCTKAGFTTYTCVCGDSYVADHVDALGHNFESGYCTRCLFRSDFEFTVYEDHVEITDYYGYYDVEAVIPSEYNGKPVTAIGAEAFSWSTNLRWVIIPDSVTSIGDSAFFCCESLALVELPDSVTSIGDSAFLGCISLGSIDLPEGITSIGESTFLRCDSLETVYIPDGITSIGDRAFYSCDNLSYVSIPNSVTSIGAEAFSLCDRLYKLVIPGSITYIGEYAFSRCEDLTDIVIQEGVTSIGDRVFADCESLTSISLPDSITYIGDSAFFNCASLTKVVIPEGVTSIGDNAFNMCKNLTSINLPDGITYIGEWAFENCESLTRIVIPAGITSIGDWTFYMCNNLTSIVIPDGVTSIGQNAFALCVSLTSIRFLGDPPAFGDTAFLRVTSTAYYPAENANWTEDVMQNYGGDLTWLPYTPHIHEYTATAVTAPTCTKQGYTTYTCSCGDRYVSDYVAALGHKCVDRVCIHCGEVFPTPFTDVPADSFYVESVLWAVESGITNGTSEDSFSPNDQCLRAHVVTFLWRANGCPEPTTTSNSFTDVKESDFFYKAVLWAVEKGITNGTSDTTFGSYDVCNRAQVVTFLHRAFESPAAATDDLPFTDVPAGAWYEAPIAWAVENSITNGMTATEFGPNAACNRAQVVTFLYRAYND